MPTTDLVLVWDKGPRFTGRSSLPRSLTDAVKGAGGVVVATDVPTGGRGRDEWVKDHLSSAPVSLDGPARQLLVERLGEDLNRLGSILSVLEGAYGAGAGVEELRPFLGEAGGVPPWDLTDAIDRGDLGGAIDMVQRMLVGGDRHALQIMATLHGHVGALLALDGSGVRTKGEAATHLGIRSEFRAGKLLQQARLLGSERIRRCLLLLADADLDLRGRSEWPDQLVLEVLVARMARVCATR
jgi:DNA polymerase-3 subunit delta